jgi:hypothetical protein
MRHTKKTVVPEHTYDQLVGVNCDICGKRGDPNSRDQFTSFYPGDNVDHCTVERKHGYSYSGDYCIETESYDVCPDCWSSVIAPLFKNPPSISMLE